MENKQEFIPKPVRGQPTKYTEAACDKVIEAAQQGKSVVGMVNACGAKSRTTFYNWQKQFPEFKEACETAKLIAQEHWEQLGYMGITGQIKGFAPAAWIFQMSNRFREDYDRTGSGGTGATTNINFNTVNLSDEQKVDRIRGLMEKLNGMGVESTSLLKKLNDSND